MNSKPRRLFQSLVFLSIALFAVAALAAFAVVSGISRAVPFERIMISLAVAIVAGTLGEMCRALFFVVNREPGK